MTKANAKRKARYPRITQFEVRIVSPEEYPDLKVNPTNHWTDMKPEDRLEHFIKTMARIWAETCRDIVGRKMGGEKALNKPSINANVSPTNTEGRGDNGQKETAME